MKKVIIFFPLLFIILFLTSPYFHILSFYKALNNYENEKVEKLIIQNDLEIGFKKDIELFSDLVKKKLKEKYGIDISWDSFTSIDYIPLQLSNPNGLIYLFHNSDKFTYNLANFFTFNKEKSEEIEKEITELNLQSQIVENNHGPNIKSLQKRIKYIFFRNLSLFELSFIEDGMKIKILFKREKIIKWRIFRIALPIEEIVNRI